MTTTPQITPTPEAPYVPPYPPLGHADFNNMAFEVGDKMPGVVQGVHEMAQAAQANAAFTQQTAEQAQIDIADAVAAGRQQIASDANEAVDEARTHANAAQVSALDAAAQAQIAAGAANFAGHWSELSGPLAMPASVKHGDRYWSLTEDVMQVQDYEPGVPGPWTLIGAVSAPVRRPVNVSPLPGTEISTPVPTLTVGAFHSLYGIAQEGVRFRVAKTADFANPIYDSGWLPAGASHQIPNDTLEPLTVYFWQAQTRDVEGAESEWSLATDFETLDIREVATPEIVSPADFSTDLKPLVVIQGSAYVNNASVPQKSVRVRLSVTEDFSVITWDSGALPANTAVTVPDGIIQPATTYHVQIAYESTNDIWSFWSQATRFTTAAQFANIIGIVLTATGGGAGTWQRVDEDFAPIATDAAFFANHATYAGIVDQTIDGQAMVKVPAFYIKTGVVPSGTHAGKRFWMVSDVPTPGFELHPAFKNAGADLAQFWVGKYQGTADGSKLGSKTGVTPLVSIDFPTMQNRANARNVSGVTGFALWNIYQLAAIQTLCLIEMGGADSQALIGQGNVSGSAALAVNHATVAQATWRGIVGLWGNVYQMVDGLQTDASSRYYIWDKNGNKTYQTTSVTVPASGYPVTLTAASGANYDLGLLFMPATVDSAAGNGTTGDRFYSNGATKVAYHGGYWSNGALAGLFCLSVSYSASGANSYVGGRLAKV